MKLSPLIVAGCSFEHVGAVRKVAHDGLWVQALDKYFLSVLDMMGMKDCKPSTSPKLDKATEVGDADPCDQPELYRKAVCTLLYPARRRPDLQAVTRWKCKRLKNPDRKSWRQLVKTVRYVKGTLDLATFMPKDGAMDKIDGYLDGDWGCDDFDRKSVSGGYLVVGGCRMHSHSRTTSQHALSSGESEIMAMSELLKEAKQLQYNMELCGCGRVEIVLHTDADVARQFAHKRGVGRMKHLDVRHCWLQAELAAKVFRVKRVDRSENASDALTHAPSKLELEKFLPNLGLFPLRCAEGSYKLMRTLLKEKPEIKDSSLLVGCLLRGAEGHVDEELPPSSISFEVFLCALLIAISTLCFACGWFLAGARKQDKRKPDKFKKKGKVVTSLMDTVFYTKGGECYHTDEQCPTLAVSQVLSRRRCSVCG